MLCWSRQSSQRIKSLLILVVLSTLSVRLAVAQNTAPIAVDDSARAEEGTGININVLSNDTDPDGDININSLSILTPPPNGEVFLHADGSIGYHPNDGFLGFDSFTYQICDFGNQCASATVTIEVFHTNHPPVALDIHTTSTDTGIDFGLTDYISDPDGNLDLNSLTFLSSPANGTLTKIEGDLFRYIPNPGFLGREMFQYQICDTDNLCASATITIDVIRENHAPVANDDTASTVLGVEITIYVADNDSDPDGNLDRSYIIINRLDTTRGTVSMVGDAVLYVPDPTYIGTDSFLYQICDTAFTCSNIATVTVTVIALNNSPNCSAAHPSISIIWPPNQNMIPIQILGVTDPDGDSLSMRITDITQNEADRGLFGGDRYPDSSGINDSSALLRAERDPHGLGRIYSLTFTVNDGKGGACDGTVVVTVPLSRK